MDFTELDSLLSELNNYRPLQEDEIKRLRDDILVDYTYNSNAIEGNTLTLDETALVLKEGITIGEKPLKDHLEAIGHRDAFYYVEELVKDKIPISESVIRNIHALVLMNNRENRGIYRKVPVRVGSEYLPPQPWEVPIKMEQLVKEYNSDWTNLHIIEKNALFHLSFESIHPFIDGNGRTGRLLLNLELMKNGYPVINIKFADRRRYYDCFADYHRTGKADKMTSLIAEYETAAIKRLIDIMSQRDKLITDEKKRKTNLFR